MITIGHIINAVSANTGHSPEMLRGPRRIQRLAHARQIVYMLAYEMCPHESTNTIGRALNRDHTTVMFGISQVKRRLRESADLVRLIDKIQVAVLQCRRPITGTLHLGAA